jgi:hypothetical protein
VNYTISTSLAAVSPLVLPVGLGYTVCKYIQDSYFLIGGIFKVTFRLDFKPFYLPITNFMAFAALLCQLITYGCLHLCPSEEDTFYSNAAKFGIFFLLISLVLFVQQAQSGQTWPYTVFDQNDIPVPDKSKSDSYTPPVLEWRHR